MEDLEEIVGCEAFQVCGQAISFGHIRRATARSCPTFRKNWKALAVGQMLDKRSAGQYNQKRHCLFDGNP
jgi:hypothetical protein